MWVLRKWPGLSRREQRIPLFARELDRLRTHGFRDAGVIPIVGTTNLARIAEAVRAESIELSREEWYALLTAAEPGPLP